MNLHQGEPEPVNIALDRDENVYWTCKSAGVILRAIEGQTALLLNVTAINEGDPEPTDVAVARNGRVYWTCTIAGIIVEARLRR